MANTLLTAGSGGGSGDMVLISTATASASATIEFTDLDSTYSSYFIEWDSLLPSTAPGTDIYCRLSTNNGSSYLSSASDYMYTCAGLAANLTAYSVANSGLAGSSFIRLTQGGIGNSGTGCQGRLSIINPDSSTKTQVFCQAVYDNGFPNHYHGFGSGQPKTSTASTTAIQLYMSSGNISSGTFKLYGIK
jgi:hypothetical protein